ncbi:MAG: hypothetical protein LBK24_02885, partial [Puniceicoccales bacterium]|nr:hypothetical protein [Puniceicoccales bacterium]
IQHKSNCARIIYLSAIGLKLCVSAAHTIIKFISDSRKIPGTDTSGTTQQREETVEDVGENLSVSKDPALTAMMDVQVAQ